MASSLRPCAVHHSSSIEALGAFSPTNSCGTRSGPRSAAAAGEVRRARSAAARTVVFMPRFPRPDNRRFAGSSPRVLGTHVRSNALRAFIGLFSFGVDSVAQFVGRRKLRAGMDGRRAGASAAARSGRGARRGRAARSGSAARPIATRVRAGGYVAERGGHFLLANNAGIGEWRAICGAATTQRLLS
jgi:hypothetical protein